MRRVSVPLLVLASLLVAGLLIPGTTSSPAPTPTPVVPAADTSQFDAGNIISDSVFYDSLSMTASDIQAFLVAKGGNCSSGTLCLKNYRITTTDRAADGLCNGYKGAANETAATIIAKVAVSCRISPRVLLVLVQKEQGLVTGSPSLHTMDRAAGYYCPDGVGGWCDPAHAGLENQLYWSGWQYQRYRAYPTNYSVVAGRNNRIAWSPNASCGSSTVYVANQATAGLYDYTPYRPNAAALAAGYGSGDTCSAYGNRNFWLYFTDWFGSTQAGDGGSIAAAYAKLGGASSWLGAPTSANTCGLTGGGCLQMFQNGILYWSRSGGTHAVSGPILTAWGTTGWEWGTLGYPVADQRCDLTGGGCLQNFQNGTVYSSTAGGAHAVSGGILTAWGVRGYELGPLGYPTADQICGLSGGGCLQNFQNGSLYWSKASGGWSVVPGAIRTAWGRTGWEFGSLGYPIGDQRCDLTGGGCVQAFQKGAVYSSKAGGTHAIIGAVFTAYGIRGYELGPLGYPTADQVCGLTGGGCLQYFQKGSLYWSKASGGYAVVPGAITTAWGRTGWEWGTLGYPTADQTCGLTGGGCLQKFQRGTIWSSSAGGTHAVSGGILTAYGKRSGEQGVLGYPVADQTCGLTGGGCLQYFQKGSLYWSPATGGYAVLAGAFADAWARTGWEWGTLGYPIGDQRCGMTDGGCLQAFEHGGVYSSKAGGTHPVSGAIFTAYAARGYEVGALGYPTSDPHATSGGTTTQDFEHGHLVQSSAGAVTQR